MGPSESATGKGKRQGGRPKRGARRPRVRKCLLKGCEQRFHPRNARQRYCNSGCRAAARKWSRWRAQQRYRATAAGQEKRNGQSRRYRERVRSRKPLTPEAVDESARVITQNFFRGLLRPARLLRDLRAPASQPLAALLLTCLPPGAGAGPPTGTALETGADLSPTY